MQTRAAPVPPSSLERFNTAPAEEAVATLLTCLNSAWWAERLTSHRPYPDLPSLLAAADEAAYDLSPDDLAEALAAETLPPLPEDTYAAAHTALGAGYAAYEARFGHVFAICLDGLAADEAVNHVLTGIRSRLVNDPDEERLIALEELRLLARGRLTRLTGARGGDPGGRAAQARPDTDGPHPANLPEPPAR
ncbi:2-oxo-4-hydroxy-4-carboxy-5-ureidoimidazoline decarboxylase [Streptomyces sp. NPDC059459]|uniref:2-oxo-4-hydroxy-4-carboxy-5-ureidoimidazoline decarboxylase n=1 Tax=unclassified Streptomyces TaxID=2593676 RepID=UPI0036B63172